MMNDIKTIAPSQDDQYNYVNIARSQKNIIRPIYLINLIFEVW